MYPHRCEECRKLLFELSSATTETLTMKGMMHHWGFAYRSVAVLTALLSISTAAESGRISGTIKIPGGVLNDTRVWALTSDCRRSYGATTDPRGDMNFRKSRQVPTGLWSVIGPSFSVKRRWL